MTMSKETVSLKDVQPMADVLSKSIWCPSSTHFRTHFNRLIRLSLAHVQACGDSGYLTRLVAAIPIKKDQARIIALLTETFPIEYLQEAKLPRFRKKPGKGTEPTWGIEQFDVFNGTNHTVTETDTTLHRSSYDRSEALDLVLDVLTTYRNDFSLADVQRLEQTLSRIRARASKSERPIA